MKSLLMVVYLLVSSSNSTAAESRGDELIVVTDSQSQKTNDVLRKHAELNRFFNHYLFFFSNFQTNLEKSALDQFLLYSAKSDLSGAGFNLGFSKVVESDFKSGDRNYIMVSSYSSLKRFINFKSKIKKDYDINCVSFRLGCGVLIWTG